MCTFILYIIKVKNKAISRNGILIDYCIIYPLGTFIRIFFSVIYILQEIPTNSFQVRTSVCFHFHADNILNWDLLYMFDKVFPIYDF